MVEHSLFFVLWNNLDENDLFLENLVDFTCITWSMWEDFKTNYLIAFVAIRLFAYFFSSLG